MMESASANIPETRKDAAGLVLQDEATARKALESMQQRNYQIDAARRQTAHDITNVTQKLTSGSTRSIRAFVHPIFSTWRF